MNNPQHSTEFYGLGIAPALLKIFNQLNFKTPTRIQAQAIPAAIDGKDIVGIELVVNFDLPTISDDYIHRSHPSALKTAVHLDPRSMVADIIPRRHAAVPDVFITAARAAKLCPP